MNWGMYAMDRTPSTSRKQWASRSLWAVADGDDQALYFKDPPKYEGIAMARIEKFPCYVRGSRPDCHVSVNK
jgi:hypothetical protein